MNDDERLSTSFCDEYLRNCVRTEFLPPLEHVRPHLLCFLNIKFPGLQESVQPKGKHTILKERERENQPVQLFLEQEKQ